MARSATAGFEAAEITFSSFRDSGNYTPLQLLHMASSKHCRKGKATDSIARCDASPQLCLNVTPGVDAFPVAIDFVDCVLGKWVDFGSKNGGFRTAPPGTTADSTVCVAAHDCTPRFPPSKPHSIYQLESTQYNPKRQLNGELREAHETKQNITISLKTPRHPLIFRFCFICLFRGRIQLFRSAHMRRRRFPGLVKLAQKISAST